MNKSTKIFIVILGVLLVFGMFATLFVYLIFKSTEDNDKLAISGFGSKVAVVELVGVIESANDIVKQFKKYREDNSI